MAVTQHGKIIRQNIFFCKKVLHETYLIKFKFEKLCGDKTNTKKKLSSIAKLLSIRKILLVVLFIMSHQDAEMLCNQIAF